MQEPEETDARAESEAKQVEFQLRGRHLTLAVVALALFGAVLFLLGRWSERVARPEGQPEGGIEESPLAGARTEPDPAAPRELTFYETLGKKTPAGFQAASKTAARKEPPVVLPGSTRVPAPPVKPKDAPPATASAPKPTEPPPAAAPSPAAGTERFRVQVASTRDATAARQLVDRLRKKGYAANLETVPGADGKNQYKVRVGNYPERGPAEEVAARIRAEEKVGAWIVKVQG
jgi:DedD protein